VVLAGTALPGRVIAIVTKVVDVIWILAGETIPRAVRIDVVSGVELCDCASKSMGDDCEAQQAGASHRDKERPHGLINAGWWNTDR